MFDIGFPELLVILFVGLVVVGPDKLPQLLKSLTKGFRTIRSYLNQTRSQLERSVGMDEIRQDLHNEKIMENLKETQKPKKPSKK
ncbi:MAG: Sec-independent protein translocase protein TatB [SAR86 cluster bacterium]|jgi:sec-independent protein translocase protein TatB|nr:Sec-independent protein translocase protein TatB [SAR86 cluster bacterium]HIC27442.1 twin-arginine translocase subunit TatB [Gammaproteobacteria bacterium]